MLSKSHGELGGCLPAMVPPWWSLFAGLEPKKDEEKTDGS